MTGRGSSNAHVLASANANASVCPAGQKNCRMPGKSKISVNGMNKATANGAGAAFKEKTAAAGNIAKGGAVTGSIGGKGTHNKKCQPGMPCAQGANGGSMGANGGGAAPAQ